MDQSETDRELADKITVGGMKNVVNGCKITKSKVVYVSTSFVFDGKKKEYFEDDTPSPSTYYGSTKFRAEELVTKSGLSHLVLRTDALYCWIEEWQREKRTNSVLRTIQTLQSGKILREVTDWYNTPTYVPDFVYATGKLIENGETGIFHLSGPDFINRYDWSLKVAEIFGFDKNLIEPIISDTLNLPAKRVNINLNNQKLFRKTGIRMNDTEEGLRKMLKYCRP